MAPLSLKRVRIIGSGLPQVDFKNILWVLPLLACLASWELLTSLQVMPTSIVPRFSDVLVKLSATALNLGFITRVLQTLSSITAGTLIALATAIPLSLAAGLRERFDTTFTPIIVLFGALPDLALVPILLLWIGPHSAAVVVMAALAAFFPIFLTLREGTRELPDDYFHVTKIFGSGKIDTLTKMVLPAILPSVVTGLRLAYEFVWEVVLATEIIARVTGIGTFIDSSVSSGAMEYAFAGVLIVGVLVLSVDRIIFGAMEARVKRWHE